MPIELTWGGPKKDQTSKTNDNVERGKVFPRVSKPNDVSRNQTDDKYRGSISERGYLETSRLNPEDHSDLSKKHTNDKHRASTVNPEDLENFRLIPADHSDFGLWEQAWENVKSEEGDWKLWPQFQGVKDLNTKSVVAEVQGFAQRRRDEAEHNQRHVFGTSLTYRKMCSKVASCAKKFEIVGDVVAQAEPVYAALPWVIIFLSVHFYALADPQ